VHRREGEGFENEEIETAPEGVGFERMPRRHVGSSLEFEKSIQARSLEVKKRRTNCAD
jgi:signal transduction histidine kinase